MEPLLEVKHAAKRFGGVRALVDANLALYAGEIHALLGENGAGKSTVDEFYNQLKLGRRNRFQHIQY